MRTSSSLEAVPIRGDTISARWRMLYMKMSITLGTCPAGSTVRAQVYTPFFWRLALRARRASQHQGVAREYGYVGQGKTVMSKRVSEERFAHI